MQLLLRILNLLSDDNYELQFEQLSEPRPIQEYLSFGDQEDWPFYGVNRVLMFSGGLDSLAGAAETMANGEHVALVSHRPIPKLDSRQRDLVQALQETYSVRALHIPVWVNKETRLGREFTQRTRSFLYSALGAAVASSIRANGIRFFENGVVSLNLPIADEVVGARASRTTHPWLLRLFSKFYTLVLEREIEVDNPYIFMTKSDVVKRVSECGGSHLIQRTSSCARTFFRTRSQWHCGMCSQCIDRRVAILAAGLQEFDPDTDYEVDVFLGARPRDEDRSMAINYVRHAIELSNISDSQLSARFASDIARAIRGAPSSGEAAEKLVRMHLRHGQDVRSVLESLIVQYSASILDGTLEQTSLLALAVGQRHLESSWQSYANRITETLSAALPVACKSQQPRNEPHLQELCDGLLIASGEKLLREFPFLRWASALTKPDWSNEKLRLWVEAKYMRSSSKPSRITDEIAADITKYSAVGRRALFIIYDPECLALTNEIQEAIELHPGMIVRFI